MDPDRTSSAETVVASGGPDAKESLSEIAPADFDAFMVARRRLLREFTDDTRRRLEADQTLVGQLTATHIGRQLDLAASEPYTHWFQETGERFGFDHLVTLAAIAGSDVTRLSQVSETGRAHFGTTEERVRELAARGDLRYGRVFETYTGLENLYMHAEGARHYAQTELARRGAAVLGPLHAERVARDVAEAILGHDSFNAGFGQHKLKGLLAAKYGGSPDTFDYATSQSPTGYLVQVLDRLEGCEPETMLRYVTEGVVHRKEPISQAIKTGIIDNAAYLLEVYDRIVQDARQVLAAAPFSVFLTFPGMQAFTHALERLPHILGLLGTPPFVAADGFYHLRDGDRYVRLETVEAVREHFLPATQLLG